MQTIDEATERVTSAARRGLRIVKQRSQRRDRVGEATYRTLEVVSDGLGATARALRQLGDAVQPPARGTQGRPAVKGGTKRTAARPTPTDETA